MSKLWKNEWPQAWAVQGQPDWKSVGSAKWNQRIGFPCVSADWPKGSQANCDVNDFNKIKLLTKLIPKQPDILSCTKCPSIVIKGWTHIGDTRVSTYYIILYCFSDLGYLCCTCHYLPSTTFGANDCCWTLGLTLQRSCRPLCCWPLDVWQSGQFTFASHWLVLRQRQNDQKAKRLWNRRRYSTTTYSFLHVSPSQPCFPLIPGRQRSAFKAPPWHRQVSSATWPCWRCCLMDSLGL